MSRSEDPAFRSPEDWADGEAAQRQRRLRRHRQDAAAYRDTFEADSGRKVLDDLIGRFAGDSYCRGDPYHTAYREGQRSVIEHIARAIGRARRHSEEDQHEHDRHDG